METAGSLAEELTCSVCLQIYQDPVILPCQHSFCEKCIDNAWAHFGLQGRVSCPQCRRNFNPRPCPERNFTLRNIVEKYNQSQAAHAESAPVMCEYCIENPAPAVKTCLKCETSFCSFHLKPHLTKKTFSDHPLIEPLADLTKRQCLDHKKILEFYCKEDEKCVCISCTVIGSHKSHTLLSLDQAAAKIKDQLKGKVANLERIKKNCSTEQQGLKISEAEIKKLTTELKGELSKEFSEWRKALEEDEKYALKLIDDEERRVLSQIRSCSETLAKQMEEMTLIDTETPKMQQMDNLSFIQDSKQLLSKFSSFEDHIESWGIPVAPTRFSPFENYYDSSDIQAAVTRFSPFEDHIESWGTPVAPTRFSHFEDHIESWGTPVAPTRCSFYGYNIGPLDIPAPLTRATGTQDRTLNLSNVRTLVMRRMEGSQKHQAAILNIIYVLVNHKLRKGLSQANASDYSNLMTPVTSGNLERTVDLTAANCFFSKSSQHLFPHLTKEIFTDHELVDTATDLTQRKCPDHKKILEYFCEDDGTCVCSSCGITGSHKSHKIVNLDEAQEARKKKLKNEVGKLQRVQQNFSIKDKDLKKSEAELKTITSKLKGELLQKFSERRKQLDKDEECVLRMIDEEEHCRLSAIQGCSATLQSMVEQLNLTKEEAQKLMEKDCILFIQNSEELTSKIIESQKIKEPDTPELALNLSNVSQLAIKKMEEMKQHDLAIVEVIGSYDRSVGRKESAGATPPQGKPATPPPPQTTPSSMGSILKETISSEPQAISLNATTTELHGCFPSQQSYSVTVAHQSDGPTDTRSQSSTRERLVQQEAKVSQGERKQKIHALERLSRVSKGEFSSLTLDLTTANRHLILFNHLRSVTYSNQEQCYSNNSERFKSHSQILCTQSFYWGCHSWDVETVGNWWGIGIAYGSILKKGNHSDLRYTERAWCLYMIMNSLSAYHNGMCTKIPLRSSINQVRVQLDYVTGTVSFCDVTDTSIHLHTFKDRFAGPLYPAFCCENNSGLKLLESKNKKQIEVFLEVTFIRHSVAQSCALCTGIDCFLNLCGITALKIRRTFMFDPGSKYSKQALDSVR
ncbi:E3 ubiquitin/ISG15 ligase TRIM25-like [Scyliorhinus canicula]|uniref:E3 ubiquitin/ISG15 ligase TRIM25-like n=1 Tax=Scyliorhinus canicula TaxID=7830 RepID=UPI0018F6801B|nr:E3 ubiquitin/ISG15 ligase TRIM25-like [Scyliorhinus canicula]